MGDMLTVTNERVDDIPLLLAEQERMGVAGLLDQYFRPHGNWQGLSPGKVVKVWLAHILSQADHRLNHVLPWVDKHRQTLQAETAQPVVLRDFDDEHLATLLTLLSDDQAWVSFEGALTRHLLRVYNLPAERVRVDGTTASGYWQVTPDGLFQFGHSKDHRPDLAQFKVMLATLDPLGLPLATLVVSGERADDPLYVPAIAQVRAGLGKRGLTYIGDCKMAALETRAFLQAGGDYYLCPLPQTQVSAEALAAYLAPVWDGTQALTPIYHDEPDGQPVQIAEGYERVQPLNGVVDGQEVRWDERRLVLRSLQQAAAAEASLDSRLQQAVDGVAALNLRKQGKRRLTDTAALRAAAEAILHKRNVVGLVQLSYAETRQERPLRPYGARPATTLITCDVQVLGVIDKAAVQAAKRSFGWRVYAANEPQAQLSLEQAVLAYRSEYLIEQGFGRLKGHPLSVTPMYLQDDRRATGLMRLLSIALRVLCVLEYRVRRQLAKQGTQLSGLYAGNARRATARPTAERLLEAFKDITLTILDDGHSIRRYLTPLSDLQTRILALLDFLPAIYAQLTGDSLVPP